MSPRQIALLLLSLLVLAMLVVSDASARTRRPVNLTAPRISGQPTVSSTLTAENGTWSGSPTSYAYQWKRCTSDGSTCSSIAGATASTYVVTSAEVRRTIKVAVTATNGSGSRTAASAPTGVVTAADTTPPTAPEGFASNGATQTSISTSWSASTDDTGVAGYHAYVNGSLAGSTTFTSYVFGSLSCGTTYTLGVSAYDAAGNTSSTSTTSTSTAACAAAPSNTAPPVVSGSTQAGQTLTASSGTWTNKPTAYAYQWQRCDGTGATCSTIAGATGSAYVLQSGDVGHTLAVVVTASNAAGSSSAGSAKTAVVTAATTTRGVSAAFDVACDKAPVTPWNGITQDILFTLQTTNGSALDTAGQCMNQLNVPQWVANVHANHRSALIAIGGIADQHWEYACNATNRSAFVANLVNYMVSNGFDGVDLDIEDNAWAATNPPVAAWDTCVQAIASAAHAATTQAGARPIVTEDVTTPWMGSWLPNMVAYVDQFNLMTYGDSCANGCADFASDIQATVNQGIPKAKMVLGIDLIDNTPQHAYRSLGATRAALSTGGAVSSIPVTALSAAIPAGEIVVATTENPPAHYQYLTTSGAAAGATAIPITSATPNYAYPAGSSIQNAYAGAWDCQNVAAYATGNGLMGVMVWDVHEDAVLHNGQFPCFGLIAPYAMP